MEIIICSAEDYNRLICRLKGGQSTDNELLSMEMLNRDLIHQDIEIMDARIEPQLLVLQPPPYQVRYPAFSRG